MEELLKTLAWGVLVLLLIPVRGQEQRQRIDDIEFFGTTGFDVNRLRNSLPLKVGQEFSANEIPDLIVKTKVSIKQLTGKEATDIAPVCCTAQRNWTVYIGLPGENLTTFTYHSRPTGKQRFSAETVSLYHDMMNLTFEALQKPGVEATEDRSKTYALSAYPPLRSKQLAMRDYATHNESLIRQIVRESADDEQRAVAAELLGYAETSKEQVSDLVYSAHDADDGVRNNAVRALGVLATADPRFVSDIPAADFIVMLNSGNWTDRNKGGLLLSILTEKRDQRLLNLLHQQAFESLLEMAQWRDNHSSSSLIILGRISGIEENQLQRLLASNEREPILSKFRK